MAKSFRQKLAVMAAVLIAALALPAFGGGTVHAANNPSYLSVVSAFKTYGQPRNSIKGDILIKKTGDTTYDSENQAVYQMKDGQDYTLGLKLNTAGIKEDLRAVKTEAGFTGTDPSTVTGDQMLDNIIIVHPESQMTADVKIPEGIDMSNVDLTNLQLGDNFGPYTDNESLKHVGIAYTDPQVYDLSGHKFKVTAANYDDTTRNLHIVMTLQIPKNYNGKSYDEIRQFNFGCLYKIVNDMPDNFTLEIPGITLDKTAKAGENMTFDGSMGQPSSTSECYMKANVTNHDNLWDFFGLKFRSNWYASQFAGGEDAANPKESTQGISLTVQKEVPKPVQPDNPKPTQPTKTDNKPAANNNQPVQKTAASKVNTGDTTPIALYVILAAAAAGVAVVLIKHRPARH